MKTRSIVTTLRAAAMATALVAVTAHAGSPRDAAARGAYLVNGMGCADCHTPLKSGAKGPQPDLSRALSGHPQDAVLPPAPAANGPWIWGGAGTNTAFWGPWGVSYAANLTPDAATGTGAWSSEQFVRAMKTGKHLGAGRPLAPPMPWQAFGQLSDTDLRAIFAYLRSLPAVPNRVPTYQPPR
ncbi:MAG: c-type cytochrome [Burkholderiaceae bacterium]